MSARDVLAFLFLAVILTAAPFLARASTTDGTINPSYGYAFGNILSWLNFACTDCNVHVTDSGLTGYAWSKQYGWINLSPDHAGVVNNCDGTLSGYAWSPKLGWINFSGASIDQNGKFIGMAGSVSAKSGSVNFSCDNCNVQTDWRQCALRPAPPPQVLISQVTATTTPNVSADVTITNEGYASYEYNYQWCVVGDINEACGQNSNIYSASAAKLIGVAQNFNTTLSATVNTSGTYYFKLTASYGGSQSTATRQFTISAPVVPTAYALKYSAGPNGSLSGTLTQTVNKNSNGTAVTATANAGYHFTNWSDGSTANPRTDSNVTADITVIANFEANSSGGGGGGGGGGSPGPITTPVLPATPVIPAKKCKTADINCDGQVNAYDFSIMMSEWGQKGANPADLNNDKITNEYDFAILMANWDS